MKDKVNIVSREFFQAALLTYLGMTLAETLREGTVSNFFNMNNLLLVVLVTGVAMVLTESEESTVGQAMAEAVAKTAENVARVAPPPMARQLNAHAQVRRQRVVDLRRAPVTAAPPSRSQHLLNLAEAAPRPAGPLSAPSAPAAPPAPASTPSRPVYAPSRPQYPAAAPVPLRPAPHKIRVAGPTPTVAPPPQTPPKRKVRQLG